ncbi:MAG: AbrB/MazE/SpoVT family DNA-binding domain-containing protein [Candidatus Bathyarchaeota archaeon]|nr:AbrB/MazE/SpoVT family DNA-binding domain-containing protein [Candidatus Bathyarchaeota archaeon]
MGRWEESLEVTVDDRGRVLIPKEIRERLGLNPGTEARIEVEDDRLIITPPVTPESFIRRMEGRITEGEPTIDPLRLKKIWERKGARR